MQVRLLVCLSLLGLICSLSSPVFAEVQGGRINVGNFADYGSLTPVMAIEITSGSAPTSSVDLVSAMWSLGSTAYDGVQYSSSGTIEVGLKNYTQNNLTLQSTPTAVISSFAEADNERSSASASITVKGQTSSTTGGCGRGKIIEWPLETYPPDSRGSTLDLMN